MKPKIRTGVFTLFTKEMIRKHPSVIPVSMVVFTALTVNVSIIIWALMRKEHHIIRTKPHRHDAMDLLNPYPLKLMVFDKYALAPKPKLHEVYKLMKAEEKKRRRDDECPEC